MSKPLIISFASLGRDNYLEASENVYLSVKDHWQYDYLFYTMDGNRNEFAGMKLTQITELPQPSTWTCNPHSVTPYQFKFGLIDHAREMGYDKIIWLDSSITLNKCPLKLLEQSNKGVMCFHNLGFETKDFISPECIASLHETYCEVAPQVWGGCIGFDFTREEVKIIFDDIIFASNNGCFDNSPTFKNHRHDQSVMSVLFHYFGVLPYNYGHIVTNIHEENKEYGNYYTFVYGRNYRQA
jgi:hypothetical protein